MKHLVCILYKGFVVDNLICNTFTTLFNSMLSMDTVFILGCQCFRSPSWNSESDSQFRSWLSFSPSVFPFVEEYFRTAPFASPQPVEAFPFRPGHSATTGSSSQGLNAIGETSERSENVTYTFMNQIRCTLLVINYWLYPCNRK